MARWTILHVMHVCGTEDPFGFVTWLQSMNLNEVVYQVEQGAEHCQIGNPGLVADEILRWLEGSIAVTHL